MRATKVGALRYFKPFMKTALLASKTEVLLKTPLYSN